MMKTLFGIVTFVLMVTLLPCHSFASPTVNSKQGRIAGSTSDHAEVFQGIPYAKPPVDGLRWAPPEASAAWYGVRKATKPGSACPQPGPPGGLGGNVPSENEDCLYLNIWRPVGTQANAKLPVMVWFHGGGMVFSAAHLYRGSWLATRGEPTIVVTVNYRLGIFGFFAHPALESENPTVESGNYGLLDQQQALRWVRDNIASFGGDPENVTIFGESGGAQSVCLQLASPLAKGLFQKAITQSGPCQFNFPQLSKSLEVGAAIAKKMGCPAEGPSVLACLRGLPVHDVLANMIPGAGLPGNGPVIGGKVLPLNVREAIAFKCFNDVPVMQGSTHDEAYYGFVAELGGGGNPVTVEGYRARLSAIFGEWTSEVLKEYPATAFSTPTVALANAIGDVGALHRIGACNTLLADRLLAAETRLYAYEFDDERAPFPFAAFEMPGPPLKGAAHTSELTYLWDNVADLNPAQRDLSLTIIRYWTNFAKSGDPNGPGLPQWKPFTPTHEWIQSLKPSDTGEASKFSDDHHCNFWSELGANTLYNYQIGN